MAAIIKRAVAGRIVKGKFVRASRQNIAEGFYAGGVFHPIRHSPDYDPSRAGEGGSKRKKKAKAKTKAKAAPKRKAAPKKKAAKKKTVKRAAPKKKAAKKKGARRR